MPQTDIGHPQNPNPRDVIAAMRWIFWGGLLCIFDITTQWVSTGSAGATGWRIDWLPDALGVMLILAGLRVLARFPLGLSYSRVLSAGVATAWVSLVISLVKFRVMYEPPAWKLFLSLFSITRLVVITLFCGALARLAVSLGASAATRSFMTTRAAFVMLYVLPLAVFYSMVPLAMLGMKVNLDIDGTAAIALLALLAVPLLHFYVSTSRLQRELSNTPPGQGGTV